MPATEKTWYDQNRLHLIFGIAALVMLGATVWMLAKDHNREWRKWQLADRAKNRWTVQAQLAQLAAENQSKLTALEQQLTAAERTKVDPTLVREFQQLVAAEDERLAAAGVQEKKADFSGLAAAVETQLRATDGTPKAADARKSLKRALQPFIDEAQRREDALTTTKKFVAAERTAAVSERGIAVGGGRPQAEIDQIEARIARLDARLAELDAAVAAANDYRRALEDVLKQIEASETDLQKQIATIDKDLNRLRENLKNDTTNPGEWLVRAPILEALYTGNIKLDQIWLPDMKIDYNFSKVARFDRCTSCHRAIDLAAAGSATQPAYPTIPKDQRVRTIDLGTPDSAPEPLATADGQQKQPTVDSVYGLVLAPRGQIDPSAVTVEVVLPDSLAAVAGLEMGDVILEINGGKIRSLADVDFYLLSEADWGQPLKVTIRRGLDEPFTTHPRLDLFVGSTSPHKKGEMGCTICHDGQGSATTFKWASHTPNTPDQAHDWSRKHGWFENHHWIFPMTPERFIESNCLKCHHEVVELEPSERFPDPPAPKLVEGYNLVRRYGCYGCHDINGYDGPDKRIGPDLRIEPNYYEVAAQILQDNGLTDEERSWAATLVARPDATDVRHQLFRAIKQDAELASAGDQSEKPRLASQTHALADGLKDVDAPGKYRRVGPSLRHLDSKVEFPWLYAWIRRPADFRPTTRMPQFFGQYYHLEPERKEFTIVDAAGNKREISDLEYTQRFEKIEIRALAGFLLKDSQPFAYLDPPKEVTEQASVERGKWLFESRGCLACHSHRDFSDIHSDQGPDLSRIAAKLDSDKGQRWLYSWLKAPHRYHSRTAMPDLLLDPIQETDANGAPTGKVTDPAADIAKFLLGVKADWQPEDVPDQNNLSAEEQAALQDLTAVWLSASFPKRRADEYARDGIPDRLAATVKVDEQVLVGMTASNRTEKQLEYVARRSLSRYGCFGCHEIPGYEQAKPIGTPLADWGRKDASRLAFENIGQFLATHGVDDADASRRDADASLGETRPQQNAPGAESLGDSDANLGEARPQETRAHELDPLDYDGDTGYFIQAINDHQRQGFLWQKLRQPRSFDYATTVTKRYDERLRMPKFPFNAHQREAVMTFILGLVSEPPAEKYIYHPSGRQQAIVQGRHVLDKYNCAGCHVLDMERWNIAFMPDQFYEPPETIDYPFLQPDFTAAQIDASLKPDSRGLLHAELHGMATRNTETGEPNVVDEDGVPLEADDDESEPFYEFALYQHALVAGEPRLVGVQNLLIPAERGKYGPAHGTAYPANGGDLARYLFPQVIAEQRKINPSATGADAWGWLPPPLTMEGEKVQADWLHDFLMDPTPIRPAVVLRMPNFHMSSDEASKLADYFAAKSSAEFPYEYNVRRREGYLAQVEQEHPHLLDDAMKIVTDGNYCVKCHAVDDFQPRGDSKTFGPNLANVYRRLRPEYVRRWIANPQRILPYTGMPVNIAYEANPPHFGGISQSLFPGTSFEQLEGLVDLLMNFDTYAKRQTSVQELVDKASGAGAPDTEPAQAAEAETPAVDQSAQR